MLFVMAEFENRKRTFAICGALALLTLLAFWPLKNCDFVNFDDPDYVTSNPHVQDGLTWRSVAWAFTTNHAANWHPLTWLSHILDWQLYGKNPLGHHATNLLLHVANTVLLFLILKRLTNTTWRSAIVSALFALHPLHVESVAWVAERKDVLSTFFFLLAIWAWARYAQKSEVGSRKSDVRPPASDLRLPTSGFYWLALLFFALGLMSKPMVVTLPFVLLLLDYWPLNRMRLAAPKPGEGGSAECRARIRLSLLYEKIPFFALAAASCAVTLIAQRSGGAVRSLGTFPIETRAQTVVVGYASYIEKTFWPKNIGAYYTHPGGWPFWEILVSVGIVAGISALVFFLRRNRPWLVVGWLWFLGTLVPVIGIVQVGGQYIADRYTYIPLIGLFVMLVWGAAEIFSRAWIEKLIVAATSVAVLVACLVLTRTQVGYWRSSAALFTHALEITTNTFTLDNTVGASLTILAHNNLGLALAQEGKIDEAIEHYSAALKIRPDLFNAHLGLGDAMAAEGKLDNAVTHYAAVLKVRPDFAEIHVRLGVALAKQGKNSESVSHFSEALRWKPDDANAHFYLAVALQGQGKIPDSIGHLRDAIRFKPDYPDALNNLAWIHASSTNADWRNGAEAVRLAKRACELTENRQPLLVGTLAAAYAADGRFSEAVATAEKARDIATSCGETNVALRNEELLKLYRQGCAVFE